MAHQLAKLRGLLARAGLIGGDGREDTEQGAAQETMWRSYKFWQGIVLGLMATSIWRMIRCAGAWYDPSC